LVLFPSFLAFPLFSTPWALYQYEWNVCYTFNTYLTTLFDVYCMVFRSIRCMHTTPTECILRLASHLYPFVLGAYTKMSICTRPSTIPWTRFPSG
jgi:hypothetical protein